MNNRNLQNKLKNLSSKNLPLLDPVYVSENDCKNCFVYELWIWMRWAKSMADLLDIFSCVSLKPPLHRRDQKNDQDAQWSPKPRKSFE